MTISSEFCDVDAEHTGPAVHVLINERPKFFCAECWKKQFPDSTFPLGPASEPVIGNGTEEKVA